VTAELVYNLLHILAGLAVAVWAAREIWRIRRARRGERILRRLLDAEAQACRCARCLPRPVGESVGESPWRGAGKNTHTLTKTHTPTPKHS
jgi:uncharacterized membrane protein YccC